MPTSTDKTTDRASLGSIAPLVTEFTALLGPDAVLPDWLRTAGQASTSARAIGGFLGRLRHRFRCIALDFPGFGLS